MKPGLQLPRLCDEPQPGTTELRVAGANGDLKAGIRECLPICR
ncbi:hypothetical protein CAter282_0184 [Collimonas arenae]|uniref:Uncharacterized protein n=1 Tax=Collimonas arenae TaxID=279058 RepID=A0A127QD68_9BURK|nr:hypothetical protein CAter282_0184 [Collimonas arenae]